MQPFTSEREALEPIRKTIDDLLTQAGFIFQGDDQYQNGDGKQYFVESILERIGSKILVSTYHDNGGRWLDLDSIAMYNDKILIYPTPEGLVLKPPIEISLDELKIRLKFNGTNTEFIDKPLKYYRLVKKIDQRSVKIQGIKEGKLKGIKSANLCEMLAFLEDVTIFNKIKNKCLSRATEKPRAKARGKQLIFGSR